MSNSPESSSETSAQASADSQSSQGGDAFDAALEAVAGSTEAARESGDWSSERARLNGELRDANERVLRAQAELENYRKRSRREMEDERKYASLPLIRDLLSVMDNLDRALEAAERNQGSSGLAEGVKMVAIQFITYLEQHGCRKIAAVGLPFDPHQHEAIAQEPSTEHAAGVVTRIARNGYMLHERVVRPSQVLVSTGQPAAQ
ncbi:MAG: nucleotide exchange factor GrpE [Pirellulales bacterium]